MKMKSRFAKKYRVALALAIAAGFTGSALAAPLTWDITPGIVGAGDSAITGGDGTWDTTNGNWTDDGGDNNVAWDNANNDTAIFGGTGGVVTLGTGITANGLTFDLTGYTVAGNTLTLAGTTPTISVTNAEDIASISSVLAGTVGMTKAGPGRLNLTSNHTYTGGTTINDGILALGTGGPTGSIRGAVTVNTGGTLLLTTANALGYTSGVKVTTIDLVGGLLDNAAAGDNGWDLTVNLTGGTMRTNGGTYNQTTAQLFSLGGSAGGSAINSLASDTASNVQGRINLRSGNPGNQLPFTVADGTAVNDLIVSAAITEASAGLGIVKNGPGRMQFTGVKTYTGTTTVNEGILALSTNGGGGIGTIRGTVTVNSGGTLVTTVGDATGYNSGVSIATLNLNGGTFNNEVNANQGYRTNVAMTGGSLTSTGGGRFNFTAGFGITTNAAATTALISSGIDIRTASNLSINVAAGSVIAGPTPGVDLNITGIVGNFTEGAASLTKTGAGTLRVSALNSYTGTTTVNDGRLLVEGASLRSTSGITIGSSATLEINASNVFSSTHLVAVANARVITVNGGTLLFSDTAETRLGNVTLNGGTWTTNREPSAYDVLLANTSTGAATVNVIGTTSSTMNGPGGLRLQGVQNFNVADVTASDAADLTVSQILAGPGSTGGAAGGINKLGAGTMVLTAANTYTGTTTISAGLLVVDGSTTSATDVQSDGTLGGIGTITGNVSGLGTVAPGNSIGTLNIIGDYNVAGTHLMEISKDPFSVLTADLLDITGSLTYAGNLQISIPGPELATLAIGDTWNLFDSTILATGTFANDAVFGTAGDGTYLPTLGSGLAWNFDYGSGELSIAAIPEPSTIVLGSLFGLGLLARRTLRRRGC